MDEPDLLPARMLNEAAYCPRLFALEHLAGEWADNEHTVQGQNTHRNVDRPSAKGLPEPEDDPERPRAVRSVHLGDPGVGVVAIIDLCEIDADGRVVPVDYKKGEAPDVPEGAWEPERVQVCAQILLLRAHGYLVDHGILYFAASRRRVQVSPDEALIARTLAVRDQARGILKRGELPPPLVDSPKCRGCSLAGICLPDEHALLTGQRVDEARPLVPPRDDRIPLHVQLRYGNLRLAGGEIVVREGDREVGRARLTETSQVAVYGNVAVTTPLLHELAQAEIPVALHSFGGWYQGSFLPVSGHNVLTRVAQHEAARDRSRSLELARAFVDAKVRNQRTLLRRNARGVPPEALGALQDTLEQLPRAADHDTLRGLEGNAARVYFANFQRMIRADLGETFVLDGRNRRPPRDPVNCLLSFAYACLVRECQHAALRVGLDAWVGYLHVPRAGRPALALDLMEEFRPIIADSVVLNAINNEVVRLDDFRCHPTGVQLEPEGKKRFLRVLERRLDELVTHPTLGTRLSYRRMLELQARLLGKALLREVDRYAGFRVR
ncbi:MAG TPA: CRISPR-associated endonuclease Cas1 [Myxococcota bacterium]|nr:CRISPR-associated endonuclease Cas1 [Myxococcota bacterium]